MERTGPRETRADRLGKITDRGDNDDARGYPDTRHEVRLIERYATLAGRDVLEVGSGNGRLTLEYAGRARSVVALEPSREQREAFRALIRSRGLEGRVRSSAGSAQNGIRGGPFDVVLFSWSLC